MASEKLNQAIARLATLDAKLYNKDFLLTWEKSRPELDAVLQTAEILEQMVLENITTRVFNGGLAVSNFRDNSTRTRFSFASAASLLGLTTQDFDEGKSQISHGETVRETANMISFFTESIGIRDDMFVGAGHEYMKEVSEAIEDGYAQKVLPNRTTLVNLQCDRDHPTQSMADLLHLKNVFGSFEALKGKKIAMTWAYSPSYGKPLSVPQAIVNLMTRFGMEVVLAHPEGYDLIPETHDIAGKFAQESGGSYTRVNSMEEAFAGADIVYPKSWAPYDVMVERTKLLRAGANDKLASLEQRCLENNKKFTDWECSEDLMAKTKDGKALYMHCLPADITNVSCDAGEVAASVFERYRVDTYKEAGHKPYIIAAMMLQSRIENPAAILKKLVETALPRKMV